jgi:hypothetical protein
MVLKLDLGYVAAAATVITVFKIEPADVFQFVAHLLGTLAHRAAQKILSLRMNPAFGSFYHG